MNACDRHLQRTRLAACAALLAAGLLLPAANLWEIRSSKFFEVDVGQKSILRGGPNPPGPIRLDLVSVSVDQPLYWPNEVVRAKVLMPGRANADVFATVQRRDASAVELPGRLDARGVAVLTLLDGEKRALPLGEYRLEVATADGKARGSTTFAVVRGALGALAIVHDFKAVASADALDQEEGAWFLGNSAGSGKRWGNGLSIRNWLLVSGQLWDGEVQTVARCMMPGCNGIVAGPPIALRAHRGEIAGTMDVGDHGGPFEVELSTSKGSLRVPFEGAGRAERDLLVAAGGVGFEHRVGFGEEPGAIQVPGRQLYVASKRTGEDPFSIESLVAVGGLLAIGIEKPVYAARVVIWSPTSSGELEPREVPVAASLAAGDVLLEHVDGPYSLVTIGGFVNGAFKEGWALAFPPSLLTIKLDVPQEVLPRSKIQIGITATDLAQVKGSGGKSGAAVSGVLEVYDTRIASRSPVAGLASSVRDSVRGASHAVASWQDRTGIDPRDEDRKRKAAEEERRKKEGKFPKVVKKRVGLQPGVDGEGAAPPAAQAGSLAADAGAAREVSAGRTGAGSASADGTPQGAPVEEIQEGERKILYCGVVRTDASGKATVDLELPAHLGRMFVRYVAVRELDFAGEQRSFEVARRTALDPQLPRAFVPGSQIEAAVGVTNNLATSVIVRASGEGVRGKFAQDVPPGRRVLRLPWSPARAGAVDFQVLDAKGQLLERRQVDVRPVGRQKVSLSRLAVSTGAPLDVPSGETATTYPGAGALLRSLVFSFVATMEAWPADASAHSAQAASLATILAAISHGLLEDEGLGRSLRAQLDKAVREIDGTLIDPAAGLVRPFPGLPGDRLWSQWTGRNLHAALEQIESEPSLAKELGPTLHRLQVLAGRIDGALGRAGVGAERGYDASGQATLPVEVDGEQRYLPLSDPALVRWAGKVLLPELDARFPTAELAFAAAAAREPSLRTFSRTGGLPELAQVAAALWIQGDHARFAQLFALLCRGLIVSQDQPMQLGPAMLGATFSAPMAMVRFLSLLSLVARSPGQPPKSARAGAPVPGPARLELPEGALVRFDRPAAVSPFEPGGRLASFARVEIFPTSVKLSEEVGLTITLDEGRNPLEYVAVIAVPSTTAVKPSPELQIDVKGELGGAQGGAGEGRLQFLSVPFRSSRTLRLSLEGAYTGSSSGVVAIRHHENGAEQVAIAIPEVTVGGAR